MENGLKVTKLNPKLSSNVFSKLTFWWMIRLFKKGRKGDLKISDMYKPLPKDESQQLGDTLEKYWTQEILRAKDADRSPSLMRSLCRMFAARYLFFSCLVALQFIVIRAYQPVVLSNLIRTFSPLAGDVSDEVKYINGTVLIALSLLAVVLFHHVNLEQNRIGMRVRIACSSLVYRKALKLHKTSSEQATSGQVVNLLSNDVSRFDLIPIFLQWIWLTPVHVAVLTYFIWQQVGIASLSGVLCMFCLAVPLQGYLGKVTGILRSKGTVRTDNRIKKMVEIVNGIQIIKLYAWEKPFEKIVETLRIKEIHVVRHLSYIKGVLLSFAVFSERTTLFVTVACYVLLGNVITADKAFSLVQFFNALQLSVAVFFPLAINIGAETLVTIKRLEDFLAMQEKQEPIKTDEVPDKTILLKNVSASWTSEAKTIKNISLRVPSGTLCAITGPVGAGKSSLLQVLLGELPVQSGTFHVGGNISYASQDPWLFLATVRQNILFGQEYDRDLYRETVKVCSLEKDFQLFPDGDKTFVGERGVSLSGGQRARINLARAVYRKADVYLFDDPLSAVDTRVGKHLFENCIVNHLKGKTRIIVTHQLHLLEAADVIIVVNNGSIVSEGKYTDIIKTEVQFKKMISVTEESDTENSEETDDVTHRRRYSDTSFKSTLSKLDTPDYEVMNEETFEREQKMSVYKKYFRAGGNWCSITWLVVVFVMSQCSCNLGDVWLSYWTQQSEIVAECSFNQNETESVLLDSPHVSSLDNWTFYSTENTSNTNNCSRETWLSSEVAIYIYTALIVTSIILTTFRSILFFKIVINSAKNLHNFMFKSLIRAPMRFFDVNPSGRILNRFSRDMGAVDELLPRVMLESIQVLFVMTGILVMVLIANYYMIVTVILLAVAFSQLKDIYISTAKNVKHLEAVAKSPVFSHFNASLNGLITVRASKAEEMLKREFDSHQDAHTSAWFLTIACIAAFGLWLDFICVTFVAAITYAFISMTSLISMSGSLVGLAISQSLILTGMVQHGMRQLAEVVSQVTSVERILEYTKIEKDGNFTTPTDVALPEGWPCNGKITFSEVSLFYTPIDPPVLKNLKFAIEPKQKVGIVGRTGAGKSSLISALFRLAPFDGQIAIDDIDTKSIGLTDLRRNISIIPQEPVLFSATMRFNLDPFNEFDDKSIWNALEQVELKDSVTSLDFLIQEGGRNLSVGERQLVCLARAILRNNKILVLDEATANVDLKTDSLIQATIRKQFSECTVLTIAHRLNTIMDSDKVLVMDAGQAVEFDHPFKLLQNTSGKFYNMVAQTGSAMMAKLISIAAISFREREAVNKM